MPLKNFSFGSVSQLKWVAERDGVISQLGSCGAEVTVSGDPNVTVSSFSAPVSLPNSVDDGKTIYHNPGYGSISRNFVFPLLSGEAIYVCVGAADPPVNVWLNYDFN